MRIDIIGMRDNDEEYFVSITSPTSHIHNGPIGKLFRKWNEESKKFIHTSETKNLASSVEHCILLKLCNDLNDYNALWDVLVTNRITSQVEITLNMDYKLPVY